LGAILQKEGWSAVHWSTVGLATDPDPTIMAWAKANDHIVLTHDLDFATVLALTHSTGPSVVQFRTEDVLAAHLKDLIIAAIKQHESDLAAGAVVVVDEAKCRIRILPI
jgi:predicted nuclease of predicted toxin-antitoxin system